VTGQATQEMPQTERKRRLVLRLVMLAPIVLFVCFIPWMVLKVRAFGRDSFLLSFEIYAIFYLGLGFVSSNWHCPGCGEWFNRIGRFGLVLPYRSACVNCGARGATSN
jgi:hypothetical protein